MSRSIATLLLTVSLASAAFAQPSDTAGVSTEPLFTRRDAVWGGAFLVASVLLFQVDERVDEWVRGDGIQDNDLIRRASKTANLATDDRVMLVGGILYLTGRLTKKRHLADIAFHAT